MIIFDWISGVRMHVAYVCVGGVLDDLSFMLLDYCNCCVCSVLIVLDLLDIVIVNNRILYLRLRGLCLVDLNDISFYSISGVMIRCVGCL